MTAKVFCLKISVIVFTIHSVLIVHLFHARNAIICCTMWQCNCFQINRRAQCRSRNKTKVPAPNLTFCKTGVIRNCKSRWSWCKNVNRLGFAIASHRKAIPDKYFLTVEAASSWSRKNAWNVSAYLCQCAVFNPMGRFTIRALKCTTWGALIYSCAISAKGSVYWDGLSIMSRLKYRIRKLLC